MMQPEEMRRLIKQVPFRPFRVHLDDGRAFEIRYPSLTMVTRRDFVIGIPLEGEPEPRVKDGVLVDWSTIERIEMLEPNPVS